MKKNVKDLVMEWEIVSVAKWLAPVGVSVVGLIYGGGYFVGQFSVISSKVNTLDTDVKALGVKIDTKIDTLRDKMDANARETREKMDKDKTELRDKIDAKKGWYW
jgi:outer membrane murein-binding lipoprotein Lpp